MPDIPNPNVIIPLTIIFVCGLVVWVVHGRAQRQSAQIRAEREQRRNQGRPQTSAAPAYAGAAGYVTPGYAGLPGSTQALPAVHQGPMSYGSPPPSPYVASAPPPESVSLYAPPPSYASTPEGMPISNHVAPIIYDPPAVPSGPSSSTVGFPSMDPTFAAPGGLGAYENNNGQLGEISTMAPTLPPSGHYVSEPELNGGSPPPADGGGSYLPSVSELEEWNRRFVPEVEEWILNHERALDAITVQHLPVEAIDRSIAARKIELSSQLDYAAHAHPSRQQGAELEEMLNAADATLEAMKVQDFASAERNHAHYLSYRDIWLPRVQRALL